VAHAGALSGILARNVSLYGVNSLPYLAILTGIVCLIVFLLKWERYVLLVPSSVMEGFTVGVAVIIALNQVPTYLPTQWERKKEYANDYYMARCW